MHFHPEELPNIKISCILTQRWNMHWVKLTRAHSLVLFINTRKSENSFRDCQRFTIRINAFFHFDNKRRSLCQMLHFLKKFFINTFETILHMVFWILFAFSVFYHFSAKHCRNAGEKLKKYITYIFNIEKNAQGFEDTRITVTRG